MRGKLRPCEHCVKSKVKQKNVQKGSVVEKTTVPGHRLYLDLLKVMVKSGTLESATINHDNWMILVCKATGKKWIDFTQTKSDVVERTCKHLNKRKSRNILV